MFTIYVLALVGRIYVGVIWCLAGAGKLAAQPTGSALARLLPANPRRRNAILAFTAGVEVLLGSLLIGGRIYPWVPGASALLFLAFIIARLSGVIKGNCGCMGGLQGEAPLGVRQIATWAAISAGLAAATPWIAVWQVPAVPMIGLVALMVVASCVIVLRREHRQRERKAETVRQLVDSLRLHQAAFLPTAEDHVRSVF